MIFVQYKLYPLTTYPSQKTLAFLYLKKVIMSLKGFQGSSTVAERNKIKMS